MSPILLIYGLMALLMDVDGNPMCSWSVDPLPALSCFAKRSMTLAAVRAGDSIACLVRAC